MPEFMHETFEGFEASINASLPIVVEYIRIKRNVGFKRRTVAMRSPGSPSAVERAVAASANDIGAVHYAGQKISSAKIHKIYAGGCPAGRRSTH